MSQYDGKITVNDHNRAEWHRMATDAYRHNLNFYGHRYSVASAVYVGPNARVDVAIYDTLQRVPPLACRRLVCR